MNELLYYPYINVPRTDWTIRTLLYYDNIGSIVPQEYYHDPERNYDGFMLELVRSGLVTPINPMAVLENPWEATQPFLDLIDRNQSSLRNRQNNFIQKNQEKIHGDKFLNTQIHADKFNNNLFYALEQLGLAERSHGQWYSVERRTASSLMNFLATLIGAKTNRLPVTDYIRPFYNRSSFAREQQKRETILTSLIPLPAEIDLRRLLKFKEKHSDLLTSFRTRVEQIVLNPVITEGSPIFDQHLAELLQRKHELAAKMNESNFNRVFFGTVCGLIGAYQGLAANSTTLTILGGLPGFASAVYSAFQIERVENIFDQSGLKYLALADRKIRERQR